MMTPLLSAARLGSTAWPDAELLARYRRDGDSAFFELLVRRHARWVLGLCRRVAGNAHDAEDATQATFLILARRAEAIRGDNLAGWLSRVAFRCATRARTRRRFDCAGDLTAIPAPETAPFDAELSHVLDEELNRLPEKYRVPVVLCYLLGRTYEEAAAELACPIGTLSGRLTRAKAMLRHRLIRRGIALGAGGFAVHLENLGSPVSAAENVISSLVSTPPAGEWIPGPASILAQGVLSMMTWKPKLLAGSLAALALALGICTWALSADPPKSPAPGTKPEVKKTDAERLQGNWVFDTASAGQGDMLGMLWTSQLKIGGDAIRVDGFLGFSGLKAPLEGTLSLDPSAEPKRFDLALEELDFAPVGDPLKIPGGKYSGLYRWDGDHLALCFNAEVGGKRPESFEQKGEKILRGTLMRAPASFKQFPKEIEIKTVDSEGRPVPGAIVSTLMSKPFPLEFLGPDGKPLEPAQLNAEQKKRREDFSKLPEGAIQEDKTGWILWNAAKTDDNGRAKFKYDDLSRGCVLVRGAANHYSAVLRVSPASLLGGRATVALRPECKVRIQARSEGLTPADAAKENSGVVYGVNIQTTDGRGFASDYSRTGELDFPLPPGEYLVQVTGGGAFGRKSARITVPENQSEYTAPAITVPSTGFRDRVGKPIPELTDIAGWKGPAVKLADQKGKIVLLHFWGYWCGQCIQEMPALMELHGKFKDRGVVIVGIHLDAEGEIATAKALDEKLALYKKDVWNGKDIPFSVALTSGKKASDDEDAGRGPLATKLGIRGYPHTVLIDREGKLVGEFPTHDAKEAAERIEYLLKPEKK